MEKVANLLQQENVGYVKENEPLASHTTMRVGGPADVLVEPYDLDAVVKTMAIIKNENVPWRIIGRGSNLLVKDEGIRGVVVKLDKALSHLEVDGELVTVGAGYPLIKLVTQISKKGLSGLEFAGGIPGSIGGAVYMNAGAHGSDMSRIVKKAHVLFNDGTVKWLTNKEMLFSYRTSRLQREGGVVLETVLQLEEGDRDKIVEAMQSHKDYRRKTQPLQYPCCGSVFRNPLPEHSGALIEKAGLKGYQIGGAQISTMHANFIVNTGGATASDVLSLIDFVKQTVYEKYGFELETEVEIVGR